MHINALSLQRYLHRPIPPGSAMAEDLINAVFADVALVVLAGEAP